MKKVRNNKTKYLFILLVVITMVLNLFIENTYVKAISGYLLLYFTLLGGSIFIVEKWKIKLELAIPINLMIIIIVMAIFAIFNLLLVGLYITVIINLLIGLYSLTKKKFNVKSLLLTPSFIFFSILYLILMLSTWGTVFHIWDEYTFWSIASKNVYYSNSFDFGSNSTMTYAMNYGPVPTVFQYLSLKLVGTYRQGIELFASQIMGFIFLLPLFKFSNKKSNFFKIVIALLIMCIPAIFVESYFYYNIYIDTLFGLITGYCILEMCTNDNQKYTTFITALSIIILALMKNSGFMFCLSLIIFYLCMILLKDDYKIKPILKNMINVFKNKRLYIFILCMIIPLFAWKNYRETYPIQTTYEYTNSESLNGVSGAIKSIINVCTSQNIGKYEESIRNFWSDIIDKPYYSSKPFPMSVGNWLCIFILISVILYMLIKNRDNKKKIMSDSISVLISCTFYLLFLQFAYISVFSSSEAVGHNSAQRYAGSILVVLVIFLIGNILKYIDDKKDNMENQKILIVLVVLLLFTPITSIADGTIMYAVRNAKAYSQVYGEKMLVSKIENTITTNDTVATIHQGTGDTNLLKIIYFATPLKIGNVDKITETNYNEEAFKSYIVEKDFLITVVLDDFIKEKVYNLFDIELEEWSIYKVLLKNEKYVLVKVKE